MELAADVLRRYVRRSRAWQVMRTELGHLSHAYLLLGGDTMALDALCDLVCAGVYCPDVCGRCTECDKVFAHNKIDVVYANGWGELMKVDGAQHIVEDAQLGSFEGGKKIYVLRNVDMQPEKVQNILLKTLEEPHDNVLFLLLAASTSGVLPTVQSRVKTVQWTPFDTHVLAELLQDQGAQNAEVLARCSGGDLTLAWQLCADECYFDHVDEVFEVLCELRTLGQVCLYIGRPLFGKEQLPLTLQIMQNVTHDLLYWHMGLKNSIIYRMQEEGYARLAQLFGPACLPAISALIDEADKKVKCYCAAINVADSLLAAILEVKKA